MKATNYLVSEPDVYIDLIRADNDVHWAIVFDNLSDAEEFAMSQSRKYVVGIHKYIDDKWESMLSMAWDEIIFDIR
jgi:hypothetical protein